MAPMLESMPQQSAASPSYLDSPLTLGMMLTLLGYYVAYFGGILRAWQQHSASRS
jgi:hypothetical protein